MWYLFTASLILSCGTLINIIMQSEESDNIDKKKQCHQFEVEECLSVLCRIKCLRV